MDCYEAFPERDCMRPSYRPGGVYRDLPDIMRSINRPNLKAKEVKKLNENG